MRHLQFWSTQKDRIEPFRAVAGERRLDRRKGPLGTHAEPHKRNASYVSPSALGQKLTSRRLIVRSAKSRLTV